MPCYGTAIMKNNPDLCPIIKNVPKGFFAKKFKDKNDCIGKTELYPDIEAVQRGSESMLVGYYQPLIQIH